MTKWLYGNSWEKFPIKKDEVWIEENTNSKLAVYDLLDGLPGFMYEADMIYSDTPWNTGNITSFYTKAGLEKRCNFNQFYTMVLQHIKNINARICYLEMGNQNFDKVYNMIKKIYPIVQYWDIVYYRKNPNKLIRAGYTKQEFDFTGIDDEKTPFLAMQNEDFNCVADMCMGKGLTAITAYNLQKRFVGTELNKRRLAVTIDKIARLGGVWKKEKERD